MLEIRPTCENCNKLLPPNSTEAMICSFECTFCKDCVETILENVCPNCGGNFENRAIRPKEKLMKYPASEIEFINPIDLATLEALKTRYKNIDPQLR